VDISTGMWFCAAVSLSENPEVVVFASRFGGAVFGTEGGLVVIEEKKGDGQ